MIYQGVRMNIGKYDQLPVQVGQVFVVDNEEIAVFRLSNGDVRAIENKSPHPKGGRLADGLVSGEFVYCPLYDWMISLVDGKVQAPDRGIVKTYLIEIEGDNVFLIV
ncbi:nitrite reductase small subunit NirD [Alkalihalobacillus sp. MEB130]|uniref:nitrite reductase small subunit NirD n=1 Tax=Alkalihalobacillus sp. MEB130 TaxID=2976704 RepID=UPI0028DEBDBD|nr:nitrite reductase small subunit NirD [Alkalihalobacillus sp. MEB130]MDT8861043.1 nitrite reductase small subunit NirD [Alkalihalobacillus sp. MEB130]